MALLSSTSGSLAIEMKNLTTGKPTLYPEIAADLEFTLQNFTGSNIILFNNDESTSDIQIAFPAGVTPEQLKKMSITLKDWKFTFEASFPCLQLTWQGTNETKWEKDAPLVFVVKNVVTTARPESYQITLSPENMDGDLELSYPVSYTVIPPPREGNKSIPEHIGLTVDNQGSIIVSRGKDVIQNKLFLNIKNAQDKPVFVGKERNDAPMIKVTFVYGNTSGSLAPAIDPDNPPPGSAYGIKAMILQDQSEGWSYFPPQGHVGSPEWIFKPNRGNKEILGAGDKANVTFIFSNIISFTPPGHTQMIVRFTGFNYDENTPYNDHVQVIDLIKQAPSPLRGVQHFFSLKPVFSVYKADDVIKVPLRWSVMNTAYAQLICSHPSVPDQTFNYTADEPLKFGDATISLSGITQDTALYFTLQAYGGDDGFLSSKQFTVLVRSHILKDPRDGKVYPTIRVKNRLWMAADLAWTPANGSWPGTGAGAGRSYIWEKASDQPPAGWRLPTRQDWEELIEYYNKLSGESYDGYNKPAYNALIQGGKSGFNAMLMGFVQESGERNDAENSGYYWSSTAGDGGYITAKFDKMRIALTTEIPLSSGKGASVRLVRDL